MVHDDFDFIWVSNETCTLLSCLWSWDDNALLNLSGSKYIETIINILVNNISGFRGVRDVFLWCLRLVEVDDDHGAVVSGEPVGLGIRTLDLINVISN